MFACTSIYRDTSLRRSESRYGDTTEFEIPGFSKPAGVSESVRLSAARDSYTYGASADYDQHF